MVPVRDVVQRRDVRRTAVPIVAPAAATRLLVIGDPEASDRFVAECNADGRDPLLLAGSLSVAELPRFDHAVAEHRPDRVLLLQGDCPDEHLKHLLDACLRHGLPLQIPETAADGDAVAVLSGADRVAYAVRPSAVHPHAYRLKRVADVATSAGLLVALSPFIAAVALLGKAAAPGPVFYVSWRVGVGEEPFPCYKFRTMVVGADVRQEELESRNEADGCLFKIRDDPRVTRIGRFLRRTSLDELPQLLNVLRGQMSLVGPRPLPLRDVARMDPRYRSRHAVLPGMTGLWQIGARGSLAASHMMELDLEYIRRWSLGLDLRILLRTVGVVVKGKGAY